MSSQLRSNNIREKLKNLPKTPGVYLFRDKNKKIIYVGKAVNLKSRVSSYFQKTVKEPKTELLVADIRDLEYIETESEVGAIILESELIKRYKPKYNTLLKDDKNFLYLKIPKEDFPLPIFVRHPSDDKAVYLGPYTDARALRKTLKYLRKIFPFRDRGDLTAKRACLYYHIGQCPGVCIGKITKKDYQKNMRSLISFFEGKNDKTLKDFRREMKKASKARDFEKAVIFRDRISNLGRINELHVLENEDFGKLDKALSGLKKHLNLNNLPIRIECYDISNISGKEAVGSMVVFENGLPKKRDYRKFKIRMAGRVDDTAMMGEVLRRRFGKVNTMQLIHLEGEKKSHPQGKKIKLIDNKKWEKLPDLIIVDGGKGQLGVALSVLEDYNLKIPIIGLAKKNEEIFFSKQPNYAKNSLDRQTANSKRLFEKIILHRTSEELYLLQRIRDEAHRFAITYFRSLHGKEAKKSALDTISGVGPKTKKKLIQGFGSVVNIRNASEKELERVVSKKIAIQIKERL